MSEDDHMINPMKTLSPGILSSPWASIDRKVYPMTEKQPMINPVKTLTPGYEEEERSEHDAVMLIISKCIDGTLSDKSKALLKVALR